MTTFLEYVAKDIYTRFGEDLAHVVVVFPNKRAALFLNQALVQLSEKPVWSPSYITISDLFRYHSDLQVADPIKAIAELHKSFVKVTGKQETLDQFFGWGQLLLADFDDIDKNEADPKKVFANLRDLHEYDDISYLTEEQKQYLKRFFSNFADQESKLKTRFIELWSRLYDVYSDYRQRLLSQGLAYEGMLYREVVSKKEMNFRYEKYLFVGFNMIQKVEQHLFQLLKEQGRALFYWDFDHYYLHDNEAGVYIRQYLDRFPNALDTQDDTIYNRFASPKHITYVCAPTETIQARYVTEWLREQQPAGISAEECGQVPPRIQAGNKTAIVMCDENLMLSVIHSIPEEVQQFNVTTGYPLQQTPIASLVMQLLALQYNGYAKRHQAFRLHYVSQVLRHPYAPLLSPASRELLKELSTKKVFYPSRQQLMVDEGLSVLFGELDSSPSEIAGIVNWLKRCVRKIAKAENSESSEYSEYAEKTHTSALFQESVFRIYTLLNRLSELIEKEDIVVDAITLHRFIKQLIGSTTIPFHGEPAVGVQLMGVLETRNLDFDHLLILSCNEGNMPKGVNDASFIPHAVRSAYELTTIDNKVAIYSYYFHRLLQRAKDITIMYNNSTEGTATGEMSRFMLQLMVGRSDNSSGDQQNEGTMHPIRKLSLQAGQTPCHREPKAMMKDQQTMRVLDSIQRLSPTAINRYLRCPLQFFYNYVAGLKDLDDTDEDQIDNRVFGNIFHRAAQLMYEQLLPHDIITKEDIDRVLNEHGKGKTGIDAVLTQSFNEELFHLPEGTTKTHLLNGLQLINREVIATYLRQLLLIDKSLVPFRVIGHEMDVQQSITLENGRKLNLYGRIDRLDEVGIDTPQHQLRVVDYKTGSKQNKEVKELADIFLPNNVTNKHTDYQLQAMAYALILDQSALPEGKISGKSSGISLPVSPALLFIQHAGTDDYSPVISIGGIPVTDMVKQHGETFMVHLKELLNEMLSSEKPFEPTPDRTRCTYCPYRALCW